MKPHANIAQPFKFCGTIDLIYVPKFFSAAEDSVSKVLRRNKRKDDTLEQW